MAWKYVIIPLFLIPLAVLFFKRKPETRYVVETFLRGVRRVAIKKTFSVSRRFYMHLFMRMKNPNPTTTNYYIRVAAFLRSDAEDIIDDKIIYADKVSLEPGEVYAFSFVSPIEMEGVSDLFVNKWIVIDLGNVADVLFVSYSESEV